MLFRFGQGVQQTYDPANYIVDTITEPARLTPLPSRPWPATQFRINAVTVEWVSGYAAPFTANATADTLTVRGRTFANGDVVRLSNSGGALPAGLTVNTDYYVVNASGDGTTIQLSTTAAGTPVDLTDTGAGLSFLGVIPDDILAALQLVVGDLYEHREAQTEYTLESNSAVRNLLYPYRIYPVQDIQ